MIDRSDHLTDVRLIRLFEAANVLPVEREAWLASGFEPSVALNYLSAGARLDEALEWEADGSNANTFARFKHLLRASGLMDDAPTPRSTTDPLLLSVRLVWQTGRDSSRDVIWNVWHEDVSHGVGPYVARCDSLRAGSTVWHHRRLRALLRRIGEAAYVVGGQLSVTLHVSDDKARSALEPLLDALVPEERTEYLLRRSERPNEPNVIVE